MGVLSRLPQRMQSFLLLLLLVLLQVSSGKSECVEDGMEYSHNYYAGRDGDGPWNNNYANSHDRLITDTWEECRDACARHKFCKGFTWKKDVSDGQNFTPRQKITNLFPDC